MALDKAILVAELRATIADLPAVMTRAVGDPITLMHSATGQTPKLQIAGLTLERNTVAQAVADDFAANPATLNELVTIDAVNYRVTNIRLSTDGVMLTLELTRE